MLVNIFITEGSCIIACCNRLSVNGSVKFFQFKMSVPLGLINVEVSKGSNCVEINVSLLLLLKHIFGQVRIFIQLLVKRGFSFLEELIFLIYLYVDCWKKSIFLSFLIVNFVFYKGTKINKFLFYCSSTLFGLTSWQ